jgi:hypothetical protein
MPIPEGFDLGQYDVQMFDYDRVAGKWTSVGGRVQTHVRPIVSSMWVLAATCCLLVDPQARWLYGVFEVAG